MSREDALRYRGSKLHLEDVPLEEIARRVGTPFYVYSRAKLLKNFMAWDKAFKAIPHLICYSMKANSSGAVLSTLAGAGAGADIVSGGELFRARKAGFSPSVIIFSGVGKTTEEIQEALKAGILFFNAESLEELEALNRAAGILKRRAPVSLRINPDVDANTHRHITTGKAENKFGIQFGDVWKACAAVRRLPNVELVGLQSHIGSQITTVKPFVDAVKKMVPLVKEAARRGIALRYLDLGGGLGITYKDETPPTPEDLARALEPHLKGLPLKLVFEPGRSLVGNAGTLVTKVLYRKKTPHKYFLIVDAAMNDLARPALYDAYHEILPGVQRKRKMRIADVVGPVCETGDYLAKGRLLPEAAAGELFAVAEAGAYGYSMSSQYNSRPRLPEVMVDGKEWKVVRSRETYEDLVRGEARG